MTSAIVRWIAAPASFAMLGLSTAAFAYWTLTPLNGSEPSRHWLLLVLLASGGTIVSLLASLSWRSWTDAHSSRLRNHFRHMLLVYPLWLMSTAAFAGSHVSHIFLYPFAALSGIIVGDLLAIRGWQYSAA